MAPLLPALAQRYSARRDDGSFVSSALAVSVPGDNADYLAKRERKPLEDFVFQGQWGKPFNPRAPRPGLT